MPESDANLDDATAASCELASPYAAAQAPQAQAVRTFLLAMASDSGPRLLAFQTSNLLVGRLPDNHLAINHNSVSRRHGKIAIGPRGATLEDLGSQNGTTVNGSPVNNGPQPIRPGDVLRFGHVPVVYFGFFDPDNPPQPERVEQSIAVTPSTTVVK